MLASCIHLRIKIDNWTEMQYISRGSSAVNSWRAQTHPLPGCAGRIGKDPAPKTHDLSNNAPERTDGAGGGTQADHATMCDTLCVTQRETNEHLGGNRCSSRSVTGLLEADKLMCHSRAHKS